MNASPDWAGDFFSGLWLDYQRAAWSAEQTEQDADLIEELLDLEPGASVLDVPCGDGRIAIALADRGFHLTGVDRSTELIDFARNAADGKVRFERHDMASLSFVDTFNGAFCWWGSIGYGADGEDDRFFSTVAAALKPGGVFILDTHAVETVLTNFEPRVWEEYDGVYAMEERWYDHETGRLETTWTLIKGGVTEVKKSSMRLYAYRELTAKLERAGFTISHTFGGHDLTPFETGDARLIIRAVRG